MSQNIYILFSCDAHAKWETMHVQGVTTDETIFKTMIAAKIKAGEMDYKGFSEKAAYQIFLQDFINKSLDYNELTYGVVLNYTDIQCTDYISLMQFPDAIDIYEELKATKVKQDIETLQLDSRSLNFSEVEVSTDYDTACFLLPGFCNRDLLEESDQYQEMKEYFNETTKVNANINAYSVGVGESESPDENELKLIEQYREEINKKYGIDQIMSYFIGFEFEPEEEY